MSAANLPVIIFGGTGFIGTTLTNWFRHRGRTVFALSSQACDATDLAAVQHELGKAHADIIFCSVVNRGVDNSIQAKQVNLRMAENLVAACRSYPPHSLSYLSSVDVYGFSPPAVISESTPPNPSDYYGAAKLESENILLQANPSFPVGIFRLPGVYGPLDKRQSLIGKLAERILTNQDIELIDEGRSKRDFLEIQDLCNILETYLASPLPILANLVSGQSLSIRSWIELIAKAAGRVTLMRNVPAEAGSRPQYNLVFDNSLVKQLFPGIPRNPPEIAVRNYLQALTT